MAWSTSASPPMVATPGCVIPIVMFLLAGECHNFRVGDQYLSRSGRLRFAGAQAAACKTETASIRRMMSGSRSRC